MKAAIINRYGDPHELHVADMPKPDYDTHDVLIRVQAVGINPFETKVRQGTMKPALSGDFPKILGGECAGVIEAVGLMITDLQPGDRVVASLGIGGGAYAEYAVAKAKNVAKIPDEVDIVQAAAMPIAAGTALQALRDKGHLRPNDRVLINGATGGVGTFAVQIAKITGAHVTAVCSTNGVALAKQLGADQVIDYTQTDFTQGTEQYDLIFDAVGKRSFDACKNRLTEQGTYVTTMPAAKQVLEQVVTLFAKQKSESVLFTFRREDMNWLLKQATAGQLQAIIERTYRLDELSQAHTHSETGHVQGKLVVTMDKESGRTDSTG